MPRSWVSTRRPRWKRACNRRRSSSSKKAPRSTARPSKLGRPIGSREEIEPLDLQTRQTMPSATAAIRIGVSGWRYPPWRGVFYPKGLQQRRELEFASRVFPSIELNGSFYSLQRPENYATWCEQTPAGFVFSVKAPRFITHIKRLRDIGAPLANFFASGVANLREKLGPILWQLPPTMRYDPQVLEGFLASLPGDTAAASRLARRHDARVTGRARIAFGPARRLRHALEVRHDSFIDPALVDQLRRHDVALVIADTAGKW